MGTGNLIVKVFKYFIIQVLQCLPINWTGVSKWLLQQCDVLLIDILDMEDELFLPHLNQCIHFLNTHLMRETSVLVHCVYGQSRSAAVCVAYLMATQGKTLLEAYNIVQQARQCISINPGFLRQLALFGRMGNDPEIMGSTSAHAELRTMMVRRQRMQTRVVDIVAVPQLTRPGTSICCRKCNYLLCTTRNQVELNLKFEFLSLVLGADKGHYYAVACRYRRIWPRVKQPAEILMPQFLLNRWYG